MGRLKKIVSGTGGSEIAEAALVIPIFFMIMLGIYWFGRAFDVYATINHAAREGARLGTASTCASCGAAPNTPPTANQIAAQVAQALQASRLDPNQVQPLTVAHAACGGVGTTSCQLPSTGPQICVYYNAQLPNTLPAGSGAPACGVTVSFQYPYNFSLPFPIPPYGANAFNLQLKADVQMKGEY
jgi:hypothetical protein